MNAWEPTAALRRAMAVTAAALGLAVLVGQPVMVVLVAPLLLCSVLGVVNRPVSRPRIRSVVAHTTLHEGQGTVWRLLLDDTEGTEYLVRATGPAPYVALHPPGGLQGTLLRDDADTAPVEVSPRRWGRHDPRPREGRAHQRVGWFPLRAGRSCTATR